MAGRFEERHIVITGGESGIGLATTRLFLAEGASVSLVGVDEARLAEVGDDLGDSVRTLVADVSDADAVEHAMARAHDSFGTIDAIFSNAGISGPNRPLVEYPVADFVRVLAVHVVGAFNVLQKGLPLMKDGGSVVINSSVIGLTAAPGESGYTAAKHAQVGLMRVAAREVAERGIRVNTIHPGPTSTPFQRAIEMRATGLAADEAAAVFEARIPLGRHATVDDIARTVLFLCSDDSAFITGTTISVDGGMRA